MSDELLYLDHNATTPVRDEVREVIAAALLDFGNPSSDHALGRRAKERLERARAEVAAALGAESDEIVFTSGGTESSNLALRGTLEFAGGSGEVVTSVVEHPATLSPCRWLEERGVVVHRLGVDECGRVRVAEAAARLGRRTVLLSVMHAQNETGVLQPVAELAALAHRAGARVHSDAAQSIGKVPVDVDELGVDLLTVAGHKLGAPKGVGALYVRRGTELAPVLRGAGHERGLRPGTENVPYAAGLGEACRLARAELAASSARIAALRDRLWRTLVAQIPDLRLHGGDAPRLPNTLNVGFPGVSGRAVLAAAPSIAASTGSACHEGGAETPSAVLTAMGLDRARALGAVRLSLGRTSDEATVDRAATALCRAYLQCREVLARGGNAP